MSTSDNKRARSASPASRRGIKRLRAELDFEDYGAQGGNFWFIAEEHFKMKTFKDAIESHCEEVCEYKTAVGPLVVFSKTACDLVARALEQNSPLQDEDEDKSQSLEDREIAVLAYDEVFTMYYYASIGMDIFYEDDGRALCLCLPADFSEDWLGILLYDLAARLYKIKRDEFEADAASFADAVSSDDAA